MKSSATILALGSLGLFGLWAGLRRAPPARSAEPFIPIVTEFIDGRVAEDFLIRLSSYSRDQPVTVLLHTYGGIVGPCVQIANALSEWEAPTTAIVPIFALSGGTLIAISADLLSMGATASLSAIDPVFGCQRSQHSDDFDNPVMKRAAQEYLTSMTRVLDRILKNRGASQARSMLLGEKAPHGWPLSISDLEANGLSVQTADPKWVGVLRPLIGEPRCE